MLRRLKLTDKERKESTKKHESKQEAKEKRKKYLKEYRSRPEIKEQEIQYRKEYNSRPKSKELLKERNRRYRITHKEEIKEFLKEYGKEVCVYVLTHTYFTISSKRLQFLIFQVIIQLIRLPNILHPFSFLTHPRTFL